VDTSERAGGYRRGLHRGCLIKADDTSTAFADTLVMANDADSFSSVRHSPWPRPEQRLLLKLRNPITVDANTVLVVPASVVATWKFTTGAGADETILGRVRWQMWFVTEDFDYTGAGVRRGHGTRGPCGRVRHL